MTKKVPTPCDKGCDTYVFLAGKAYCERCFLTREESENWDYMPRDFKKLAKSFAKKRRKVYFKGQDTTPTEYEVSTPVL